MKNTVRNELVLTFKRVGRFEGTIKDGKGGLEHITMNIYSSYEFRKRKF